MAGDRPLRVLVANRGEIALRILRALTELGHESVAVHSEADRGAPYLRHADQVVCIGPAEPRESYLDIERLIAAGRATGASAVHPGYGFLAENPEFATAVEAEGWHFLGPTAESMRQMGDKTEARRLAEEAGVPVTPGHLPKKLTPRAIRKQVEALGLPVIIKAAAGGGGKGMRVVHELDALEESVAAATREAQAAFGDGRVFLERYIENARHVEVQVLGDGQGDAVTVGERDCSLQRRHQKIIEESPAPGLPLDVRAAMHEAARQLATRTRYRGAGTVEFLLTPDGEFYFLEMNTRLQVEHPVSELVHGIDLVEAQVAIATGRPLPVVPPPRGHAIEVRVCAEQPANGFLPSVGLLHAVILPSGPGIRVDSGIESGGEVTVHYDPLLAKIIAWAEDRPRAIARLRRALAETFIAGVDTNIAFCRDLLAHDAFAHGEIHTGLVEAEFADWQDGLPQDEWWTAALTVARQLVGGGRARIGDGGPREPGVWTTLPGWRIAP